MTGTASSFFSFTLVSRHSSVEGCLCGLCRSSNAGFMYKPGAGAAIAAVSRVHTVLAGPFGHSSRTALVHELNQLVVMIVVRAQVAPALGLLTISTLVVELVMLNVSVFKSRFKALKVCTFCFIALV
jgi:hypothetical protein